MIASQDSLGFLVPLKYFPQNFWRFGQFQVDVYPFWGIHVKYWGGYYMILWDIVGGCLNLWWWTDDESWTYDVHMMFMIVINIHDVRYCCCFCCMKVSNPIFPDDWKIIETLGTSGSHCMDPPNLRLHLGGRYHCHLGEYKYSGNWGPVVSSTKESEAWLFLHLVLLHYVDALSQGWWVFKSWSIFQGFVIMNPMSFFDSTVLD